MIFLVEPDEALENMALEMAVLAHNSSFSHV